MKAVKKTRRIHLAKKPTRARTSQRKQLEEKLDESQARFRDLFENAPVGIFHSLPAGRYLRVNPAAARMFGFSSPDEMISTIANAATQLYADPLKHAQVLAKTLETNDWSRTVNQYRHRDGSIVTAYLTIRKVLDANGQLAYLEGFIENITERKQAEDALREAEHFARTTIDALSAHICVLDETGTIVAVNRAWRDFAYANSVEGKNIAEGIDYLATCDAATGADAVIATQVAAAIRRIIGGATETFSIEYACPSAVEQRWFVARVSNFPGGGTARVVIAHENITERKLAEERLRESEERYRSLYENSGDAILLTAPDGRIFSANPTACRIFGRTEAEICQGGREALTDVTDPQFLMALEERRRTGRFKGELTLLRGDGQKFTGEVTSTVFKDEKGDLRTSMIIRDITERKLAEEKLIESERKYRMLFENMSNGSALHEMIFDDQGKPSDYITLEVNSEYERLLGIKRERIVGQRAYQAVPNLDREWLEIFGQVVLTGQPRHYVQYASNIDRWFEGSAFRPTAGQFCVTFDDITERKRAEETRTQLIAQLRSSREQLQTLSRRMVNLQEEERREIARELHDEIGQWLTGLKLLLHMSKDMPMEKILVNIDQAQQTLAELLTRVRNISLDLRPAMLDDLGLVPTLVWYVERYTTQTHIHVNLKHNGLEGKRFDSAIETAAFRIIQEGLTNVARHAMVPEASVRMGATLDGLTLQIQDWGKGFDFASVIAAGQASGLTGMRERAILLGGNLTIESSPNGGTCLTAEIPLKDWVERRVNDRFDPAGG